MAATEANPEITQRIEIVGERRRAHGAAFRAEVVAASLVPGARVREVAERHGVCPGLIYRWRRLAAATGAGRPWLLPVQIVGEALPSPVKPPRPLPSQGRLSGVIEIELAGGERVRVDEAVSLPALRRVLALLRG